ncbi:hypothetical protein [Terriglobus tenax]|nr:hypothetical protein [Terriglobus tenax]
MLAQVGGLNPGFNAFGNHIQLQLSRHVNNVRDHGAGGALCPDGDGMAT